MKIATIHYDPDCGSPREYDNIGTLCLFHRRRNLPNESGRSVEDLRESLASPGFSGVWLPVYCYEHSGIKLSTEPFSCPWDSGQLGVIFVTWEKLRDEFSHILNKDLLREYAERYLREEVEVFSQWLNGECYGYIIKDEDGSDIDSCWGFIGYAAVKGAAIEAGADRVEEEVRE